MLLHVAAGLFGYLLGSFPAAYLAVRWKSNIDIRQAGSGNVGTLNSYEVTNSKAVGIVVLVVDVLKGIVAVFAGRILVPADPFAGAAVAAAAAVVGHSFPVWLSFRGGRGLATAAGALLALQWLAVLVWGVGWGLVFLVARRVNIGNLAGTILLLMVLLLLPGDILREFLPGGATAGGFRLFGGVVLGVILVRLVGPVKEYMQDRRAGRATGGSTEKRA